jgi:hypothetical protein
MGEPIALEWVYEKTHIQRWLHEGEGPHDRARVSVGMLPDGRWFSSTTERGRAVNGWAHPDEAGARQHADALMAERDGGWTELPTVPA